MDKLTSMYDLYMEDIHVNDWYKGNLPEDDYSQRGWHSLSCCFPRRLIKDMWLQNDHSSRVAFRLIGFLWGKKPTTRYLQDLK